MSSQSLPLTLDIKRTDTAQQRVFGWAYISRYADGTLVEDQWRAHIPPQVLEQAVYEFVEGGKAIGGEVHSRTKDGNPVRVGAICESMMWDAKKATSFGVEDVGEFSGWWVGIHVEDADVWAKVQDGTYKDLSIGGTATMVDIDDDADLMEACKDALKK